MCMRVVTVHAGGRQLKGRSATLMVGGLFLFVMMAEVLFSMMLRTFALLIVDLFKIHIKRPHRPLHG